MTICFVMFLTLEFSGCAKNNLPHDKTAEFEQAPKEPNWASAGVVVYGYECPGWIENTNDFPVRIQMTRTKQMHGNDATMWILTFQPAQVKKTNGNISEKCIFHIYDMEGKHIGLIVPEKPEN